MRDVREGGTQRTGPMRLQWLEPGAPRCGVWHRRSPRARVAPLCSDPGRSGQRETEGIGITTAGVLSRSARDLQNERSGTADPRDGSGLCGKISQHPTVGCLFTHDTGQEQRCWSARFRYIKGGVSAWLLSCLRRTLAFGIGGRGGGVSSPLGTSIATTTHGVLMENEFWAKAEATSPRARASLANIVCDVCDENGMQSPKMKDENDRWEGYVIELTMGKGGGGLCRWVS